MGCLLCILLEIRWQHLISRTIEISIFPVGFHQLYRSVAHMFSIHFFKTVEKVIWIGEGDKTIASSLSCSSVSNDSGHLKGRVSPEDTG